MNVNRWSCLKHNIEWSQPFVDGYHAECPFCAQDKIKALRDELREVRGQRDKLVEAFELVNLLKINAQDYQQSEAEPD